MTSAYHEPLNCSAEPAVEMSSDLFDNWLDPNRDRGARCGRVALMIRGELDLCLPALVTVEARWPAMKEEQALRAADSARWTGTFGGRSRAARPTERLGGTTR